MFRDSLVCFGIVCVSVFSGGCAVVAGIGKEKAKRSSEFTMEVADLEGLEVRTLNGRIECVGRDVDEIQVEAEFTAWAMTVEKAEQDVEMMSLDRSVEDGVARLIAQIPNKINGSISIRVVVPRGFKVGLKTTNGAVAVERIVGNTSVKATNGIIRVFDCEGTIGAKSSNGKISIEGDVLKQVNAETSNGSVRVRGRLLPGSHHLETSNGSVDVRLTGGSVDMRATTSNGTIRADGKKVKRGRTVRIGGGGDTGKGVAQLSIETSNGSIDVDIAERHDHDDHDHEGDDDDEDDHDDGDDD